MRALGALLVGITLGLQGCSTLEGSIVARAVDRMYPGQPVVNTYHHGRLPWGTWMTVSMHRVGGPPRGRPGLPVGEVRLSGTTTLELWADEADAGAVRAQLDTATEGCAEPKLQLQHAARRLGEAFPGWLVLQGPRRVVVFVTPPGQGAALWASSLASTPDRLELTLAAPLPESRACAWSQHWVAETLDTALHELFHLHRFVQHGPATDLLREEFVAYGIGECVQRALQGRMPRTLSFPGLDGSSPAAVFAHVDAGRLPASIAGRWLAYRWWERQFTAGAGAAAPGLEACLRWPDRYADPREVFR